MEVVGKHRRVCVSSGLYDARQQRRGTSQEKRGVLLSRGYRSRKFKWITQDAHETRYVLELSLEGGAHSVPRHGESRPEGDPLTASKRAEKNKGEVSIRKKEKKQCSAAPEARNQKTSHD